MKKKNFGFTLIELLIVVAIIAILAAIAIPNFLAAQIRSKVTRQRAELRTLTTALESYYVDNTAYPMMVNQAGNLQDTGQLHISNTITSPVSYISRQPADVFRMGKTYSPTEPMRPYYYYQNWNWYYLHPTITTPGAITYAQQWYGQWKMVAAGPFKVTTSTLDVEWTIPYDPTNGTASYGGIFRTQLRPAGDLPGN
jgi:type II secretion system protein G